MIWNEVTNINFTLRGFMAATINKNKTRVKTFIDINLWLS